MNEWYGQRMAPFQVHDFVRLTRPFDEFGLEEGDQGEIVEIVSCVHVRVKFSKLSGRALVLLNKDVELRE